MEKQLTITQENKRVLLILIVQTTLLIAGFILRYIYDSGWVAVIESIVGFSFFWLISNAKLFNRINKEKTSLYYWSFLNLLGGIVFFGIMFYEKLMS
ncbi:hypothetical protein A5886_000353 [Enterococcus sp. 8G7_MSG3316]|uniref:Uncharacterized protein n=1 Tax=Candidatus Enterococcus testudinis TaxID=1834191 RepID=A0A242A3V0_9ENTE|nr:hypothetical protein [Enterococcus sp. 8G7_MSG3316]OTN75283.1 hypothetical protein A5886_000353 [Enterococcus sp. 8G7_MSG3316]